MHSTSVYRINEPSVAAEDLEEEIVVVSFATGRYFSMRDTAAEVWRLIQSGHDFGAIVAHFSSSGADVSDSLRAFMRRLVEQGLIEQADPIAAEPESPPPAEGFEPPVLEEFDEMKEMLLYDPIHDVDETGWPNLPDHSLTDRE